MGDIFFVIFVLKIQKKPAKFSRLNKKTGCFFFSKCRSIHCD